MNPLTPNNQHNLLYGVWRLAEYTTNPQNSHCKEYPFGREVNGTLLYTKTYMSAQIMKCITPQRETPATVDPLNFIAYSGPYHFNVAEMIVTHFVEVSIEPAWIGTQQQRHVIFKDNELRLRTVRPVILNGCELHATLTWLKQR